MSGDLPLPNERDLTRRYALTLAQYVELLEAQGGVCAVCGKPPTERTGPLVVDHDHDTLAVDGLVHGSPCNRRLLQQVRRYLADPPGRRFGWTVPPDLEAQTIAKREREKLAARTRRAAAKRPAATKATFSFDQLRDMTQPGPTGAAIEALEREPEPPPTAPAWGWSEPQQPKPEHERPKRRLRLRFRSGGSVRSGG
jgi:hypothetical protein